MGNERSAGRGVFEDELMTDDEIRAAKALSGNENAGAFSF